MTHRRATASEVARRAGVSRSAVSRVFTPGASASPRTAEKVRKAADELGYRPNVLARAMVSGRSRIIGLVLAQLENQFYPDVIERLSSDLQARGYHLLIFMAGQEAETVDGILEEILDYQPDGIIAASVTLSSELTRRCRAAGVPVVMFNRSQDDTNLSAVTSDNVAGGRRVAEFLMAGRHRRIGYIGGLAGASTQRDREFGFSAALQSAGVDIHARAEADFRADTAREAAREMFAPGAEPCDAVFVAGDVMAFAVMDVLRYELGLEVPGDVSVVGYDDVPAAAWAAYDLTTLRQPARRMAAEAVSILVEQIEGGPDVAPMRLAIDGPLILRGSARIPSDWPVG